MPNVINLMNTIRANSSADYQARVPEATKDNIANVGNPILEYATVFNEFAVNLVNRIAFTVVQNRMWNNPLSPLKKSKTPLGGDIQLIHTNPVKGEAYDLNGADLLTPKRPDSVQVVFRLNRRDKYKVTVNYDELQKAFVSWGEFDMYVSSIMNSMYSGDSIDEYLLMKHTLSQAVSDGYAVKKTLETNPASSPDSGTAFVKAIKSYSSVMRFPSTAYNAYATKTGKDARITWTEADDQYLIVCAPLLASLDVDVLAKAFNISNVEFMAKTLVVDSFEPTASGETICAILCDQAFAQFYDDVYRSEDARNGSGLFANFFLHHWQTLTVNPMANAIAFVVSE